jgi:hypothetical protein
MGVLAPSPRTAILGVPEEELDITFERLFWAESDEDVRLLLLRVQEEDLEELGL